MFTPLNKSHVMCHVSGVTCHLSHVTCHMSHVTFFLLSFFGQGGEAYRWRFCYRRHLPRLVFFRLVWNTVSNCKQMLLNIVFCSPEPKMPSNINIGPHLWSLDLIIVIGTIFKMARHQGGTLPHKGLSNVNNSCRSTFLKLYLKFSNKKIWF